MASRAVLLALLVAGSAACGRLHFRTQPDIPLQPPPPPPRIIEPMDAQPAEPAVKPLPSDAPSAGPTSSQGPRAPKEGLRRAPPKTGRTDQAPTPPPAPPREDPVPQRELQTTADAGEIEKHIRELLASAERDFARIDVRTLSADAKVQYDVARRFGQQAEEALKAKNLVFAEQLANKAAELAALLVSR